MEKGSKEKSDIGSALSETTHSLSIKDTLSSSGRKESFPKGDSFAMASPETTHSLSTKDTTSSSGRNAALPKQDKSFGMASPETTTHFSSIECSCSLSLSERNQVVQKKDQSFTMSSPGTSHTFSLEETSSSDGGTPAAATENSSSNKENGVGDFTEWMPQEIVIKILSYLCPQELSMSVAPVCQRWRYISHDPVLWQELNIKSISKVNLCKVVRQCTCLRRLVLLGRDNLSVGETMVITDFCTLLKELDLSFSKAVTASHLKPFVEKCLLLEYVNIEGCENVDSEVVNVLARAPRLCRLNFSHCTRLRDSDVLQLAQNLTKITTLNIDGILWVTDE